MTDTKDSPLSAAEIKGMLDGATDGPWSIGAPQDKIIAVDDSGSVRTTSNGWGKVVACTGARGWHGPNEDMNNACLIAATPTIAQQYLDLMEAQRWVPIGEIDESWKDGRPVDLLLEFDSGHARYCDCIYHDGAWKQKAQMGCSSFMQHKITHVRLPPAPPESPST